MASDLIGAAQYQQFVKFATDAVSSTGSKTVAVLDAADPLGVRKISTQQHDRVGAFSRSADVKRDNDDVRAMFKSSVISLFGGFERDVPDVVLKALQFVWISDGFSDKLHGHEQQGGYHAALVAFGGFPFKCADCDEKCVDATFLLVCFRLPVDFCQVVLRVKWQI